MELIKYCLEQVHVHRFQGVCHLSLLGRKLRHCRGAINQHFSLDFYLQTITSILNLLEKSKYSFQAFGPLGHSTGKNPLVLIGYLDHLV